MNLFEQLRKRGFDIEVGSDNGQDVATRRVWCRLRRTENEWSTAVAATMDDAIIGALAKRLAGGGQVIDEHA